MKSINPFSSRLSNIDLLRQAQEKVQSSRKEKLTDEFVKVKSSAAENSLAGTIEILRKTVEDQNKKIDLLNAQKAEYEEVKALKQAQKAEAAQQLLEFKALKQAQKAEAAQQLLEAKTLKQAQKLVVSEKLKQELVSLKDEVTETIDSKINSTKTEIIDQIEVSNANLQEKIESFQAENQELIINIQTEGATTAQNQKSLDEALFTKIILSEMQQNATQAVVSQVAAELESQLNTVIENSDIKHQALNYLTLNEAKSFADQNGFDKSVERLSNVMSEIEKDSDIMEEVTKLLETQIKFNDGDVDLLADDNSDTYLSE